MFISVHELFKIGIGPSSSHTIGPMMASLDFIKQLDSVAQTAPLRIRCTLKGSLAFTGKGHATDYAVVLGLHGYSPERLININAQTLVHTLWEQDTIVISPTLSVGFDPAQDIIFDYGDPLPEHPNGMIFELYTPDKVLSHKTYFSIGGGFINTKAQISKLQAPLKSTDYDQHPFPFHTADEMLALADKHQLSIAKMKRANELVLESESTLNSKLDSVWQAMQTSIANGLQAEGILPGGLSIPRRAKRMHQKLVDTSETASVNEWLCAYAMAVNEENAAGHMIVTAPTNGAAGVIPAVWHYWVTHRGGSLAQTYDYLLTASAIGGLIKHNSSISGAEVGCQGEVGSASAMAAAGLCAVLGGSPQQVENAAEIALEHHLGMTCDPVKGLVQVPCIERNGFGAIKAYTAATLAMHGTGKHFISLDQCITTMQQTGLEMSSKYKETSLGGLAVNSTEC